VTAFCLDIHARYQCQHAGACCESWSVPAEPQVIDLVREHKVRRDGVTGEMFLSSPAEDGTKKWIVARDDRGECVFFERDRGRLCLIHRALGSDALPSACRHFPRKIVIDRRGTLISLSHFCPTAAATLLAPGTLSIVEALPPLRLSGPIEGLDASDALPPLVRPGLLCDIQGYDEWERAGTSVFARPDLGFETCLDIVAAATESIRGWKPGGEPLADRVRASFHTAYGSTATRNWSPSCAIERVRSLTIGEVGDDLTTIEAFDEKWDDYPGRHVDWFNAGMKNYLAARLFANWIAYQGRGLRTIVEWLRTCAAVVGHELLRAPAESSSAPDTTSFIEAVRRADLLLLHVLDSASFAKHAATIEES
jgi:Fe-S-cluster containining protein